MKFLAQKPEEDDVVLREGQRFQNRYGHEYILAQVSQKSYALINLASGNRWIDGESMQALAERMNKENAQLVDSLGWVLVFTPKED